MKHDRQLSGLQGLKIEIKSNGREDIGKALKRFKKTCERDGLFRELRKREFYVKPSAIEKQKQFRKRIRARLAQKGLLKEQNMSDRLTD